MIYISHALGYIVPFLVVLTILVFVHEFGHFWVARRCGVKIDSFSIGFGAEIFGRTDRYGTRWKLSMLPLGGYVKMFGDAEEASWTDTVDTTRMTPAEREGVFATKPVWARAAIVAAGPMANFIFTILMLAVLFAAVGQRVSKPDVSEVVADSAAARAGIQPGDIFVSIDGRTIKRFEDIQEIVTLRPGEAMSIVVDRANAPVALSATPESVTETDRFGNVEHIGRLGIKHAGSSEVVRDNPVKAVGEAWRETWMIAHEELTSVWQMVKGTRPADQMSGVFGIAKMSGDSARSGTVDLIYFMALLSVNLGLINLFPIPVLDGGHLLFYAIEAVRGKPPGEAVMKYSFRFGLALVLTLAVFSNWNDLVHLGFVDFVRGHIS